MIRVLTYNIHYGGLGREDLITKVIQEADSDVNLLVEAKNESIIKNIAQKVGMKYVIVNDYKAQLALITRLPISNWRYHLSSNVKRPLLEVTINTDVKTSFTLFGVHLQSHYLRRDEKLRLTQLKYYLSKISESNTSLNLLVGDFNALAPNDSVNLKNSPFLVRLMLWLERNHIYRDAISLVLEHGYNDCFRLINSNDNGFTIPTPKPKVRLDYIFANANMSRYLKNCYVLTDSICVKQASDHFPVLAEFEF